MIFIQPSFLCRMRNKKKIITVTINDWLWTIGLDFQISIKELLLVRPLKRRKQASDCKCRDWPLRTFCSTRRQQPIRLKTLNRVDITNLRE